MARPFQDVSYALARQRGINLDSQALPGVIVHHVQTTEPARIGQAVDDEVHRATLTRPCRLRVNHVLDGCNALAFAHAQSCLAVQPSNALMVCLPALPAQQHMDPTVAIAPLS